MSVLDTGAPGYFGGHTTQMAALRTYIKGVCCESFVMNLKVQMEFRPGEHVRAVISE